MSWEAPDSAHLLSPERRSSKASDHGVPSQGEHLGSTSTWNQLSLGACSLQAFLTTLKRSLFRKIRKSKRKTIFRKRLLRFHMSLQKAASSHSFILVVASAMPVHSLLALSHFSWLNLSKNNSILSILQYFDPHFFLAESLKSNPSKSPWTLGPIALRTLSPLELSMMELGRPWPSSATISSCLEASDGRFPLGTNEAWWTGDNHDQTKMGDSEMISVVEVATNFSWSTVGIMVDVTNSCFLSNWWLGGRLVTRTGPRKK